MKYTCKTGDLHRAVTENVIKIILYSACYLQYLTHVLLVHNCTQDVFRNIRSQYSVCKAAFANTIT